MIIRPPVNKPRWFGLTGIGYTPSDGKIVTGIPELDELAWPPEKGGTLNEPLPTNEPGIYFKDINAWKYEQYNPTSQQWVELTDTIYSTQFGMGSKISGAERDDMYATQAVITKRYGTYSYVNGVGVFRPNGWIGGFVFPTQGLIAATNNAQPVSNPNIIPLMRNQWVIDAKAIFTKHAYIRERQDGDQPTPPVTTVPEFTRISRRDNFQYNWSEEIPVDECTIGWIGTSEWDQNIVFDVHRVNSDVQNFMYGYNYPKYYASDNYKSFLQVGVASTQAMTVGIDFSDSLISYQRVYDNGVATDWVKVLYNNRTANLEDIKDMLIKGTYAKTQVYMGREGAGALCGFRLYGGGN